MFVPGKASNAGRVGLFGLEQSQNALRITWSAKEVDERLQEMMKDIHEKCVGFVTESDGYINYVKSCKWSQHWWLCQSGRRHARQWSRLMLKKRVTA